MDNLVSRKIRKKFKNLKMNKNSDDRVYKFEESPLPESPSWMQMFVKKGSGKGTKYEPQKGGCALAYQTNNASTSAANTSSHEVNSRDESAEKANNNTFFRNGWMSNLEENKRLITEETMTGYGSTQSEPKILKSVKLSGHEISKNSEKNKTGLKSIIRDYPTIRTKKSPDSDDALFDDVIKIGYISS